MFFAMRFIPTLVLSLLAAASVGQALRPVTLHAQTPPASQAPAPKTQEPPKTPPSAPAPQAPGTAKPAAPAQGTPTPTVDAAKALAKGVVVPADYVIGPEDVLVVVFWREKDLTSEVVVRPDGRISIPVIQDVEAAGLTPDQLRVKLTEQAQRYVEDPNVTIIVKQINSRRVYITGMVGKAGPYALIGPITVVQLIAMAGGLLEYADAKNILIMRTETGKQVSFPFNYREVTEGKNLQQNISLKPGDTVIVP
jgi:polysaccharide biosynthesis/export protein